MKGLPGSTAAAARTLARPAVRGLIQVLAAPDRHQPGGGRARGGGR